MHAAREEEHACGARVEHDDRYRAEPRERGEPRLKKFHLQSLRPLGFGLRRAFARGG